MILLIFISCLLSGFSAAPSSGRIIGGVEANITDIPYIVSFQLGKDHQCGGTIINRNVIVTAAHCITDKPEKYFVQAGSAIREINGTLIPVRDIIVHQNFSAKTIDYDVALVILNGKLPYSTTIQPIELAKEEPSSGEMVLVAGWGKKFVWSNSLAEKLQKVEVAVIDKVKCNKAYNGLVTDRMMCAGIDLIGGKDACLGDSGGPLAIGGKLVGIVSWGRGCAKPDFAGVYTSVAKVVDWIEDTLNKIENRF